MIMLISFDALHWYLAPDMYVCVCIQGSLRDLLYGARPDQAYIVKYASNKIANAPNTGLSIRSAAVYGRQILTALSFLHHKCIGHGE